MTDPPAPLDEAEIKAETRALYTELNRRLEATAASRHARFFNFGYRPLPGEETAGPELPPRLPNRDSAQLLLEVVGDADLSGRVAEIGCGRGGNLWLMHRMLGAEELVGVDLTQDSLIHAKADSRADHALFVTGDAEAVPLAADSADVVLSLETSCCYPDVEAFHHEVARVLKPGGTFLYADLMPAEIIPAIERVMNGLGLVRERHRDISPNVAESRRARAARQAEAFTVEADGRTNTEWVGAEGTLVHDAISGSENQYFASRFVAGPDVGPRPGTRFMTDGERDLLRGAAHLGNELLAFGAG
ncbi:MAG: class I SAM-dependent methyltransferase [Actinomycetota bacterium]